MFVSLIPFSLQGCNIQSSKTVPKSVNPNYNALLHFGGVDTGVINRSSLHISVLGSTMMS